MSKKKKKNNNNKANKANNKQTDIKNENQISENTESEQKKNSKLKEKWNIIKTNPIMIITTDILKLFAFLFVVEVAIIIVPNSVALVGSLLNINAQSTSNDMVMWQSCCTFAVLCEFYVMLIILRKIGGSLSLVKKHKEKKNG